MPLKEPGELVTEMDIPSGENFSSCYMELCKKHRVRPLPAICVTLPHYLEFTTDRIKIDEWGPILNSLSVDRTLKSIGIKSRYQYRKPLEEVNSEAKARAVGKAPVVLTRFVLEWLSHSVAQCVRNSPVLTSLELEGIPFPPDCLAVLCVGLSSTKTLRHLSLSKCYVGDGGCELICKTIADVQSIRSLDLSNCDLTSRSGLALAASLSRQKLHLFHDTWKQSLRYREPNFDAMPGLRRLTLNDNPRLGDSAISDIVEAVKDSLWLKALDLQRCGLTDVVASDILELLDHNETLVVVDVRLNPNLRDELVQEISRKLEANIPSGKSEFKWLSLPKKHVNKATKRNESCDDSQITRAKNKKSTNRRPVCLPRTAPCRSTPIEKEKVRPLSSVSMEHPKLQTSPVVSKKLLHLDLNAQIGSSNGFFKELKEEEATKIESHQDNLKEDKNEDTEMKVVEIVNQDFHKEDQMNPADKLEELLQQLSKAQTEHKRLLEETKKHDLLLYEERIRREMAEAKLRSLKNDLSELENAVKEKERETRGFFLVSKNSLDEICNSFESLLEMLGSVSRNRSISSESEEESINKDVIRTKMALLIRKTKSESHRRGYFGEEVPKDPYKFVRSEADMRNSLPPSDRILLERHIGDSPDIVSPSLKESFRKKENSFREGDNSFRQMGDMKRLYVPSLVSERARAIFTQILRGNMIVNVSSQ